MNEKKEYYNRMGKQVLVTTIIDYSNMLDDLLPQLQAHKDKEDKLREMFEDETLKKLNKYYYGDSYELEVHELRKDILQILDGSDE